MTKPLILKGTSFTEFSERRYISLLPSCPTTYYCPIHHTKFPKFLPLNLLSLCSASEHHWAPLNVQSCTRPCLASLAPYTTTQSLTWAWPAMPVAHPVSRITRIAMHTTRIASAIARSLALALHDCWNRCTSLAQAQRASPNLPHIVQHPSQPARTWASQLVPELACVHPSWPEPQELAGVGRSYPEHPETTGPPPEPRTLPQRFL
jgi:hypothetical protein